MTSGSRRSGKGSAGRPELLGEAEVREIEDRLRALERERDALAEESRHLRRRAQAAMARIHEGRRVDREVREIGSEMRALARRARVRGVGEVGAVHDALQEAVEATLLDRISRGEPLPGRGALGVGPEAYLTGLGDLAGEIRRLALAALSEGRLEVARQRLREMDSVYRLLLRFEAPRAIVSLKPKQDTARALLERTRGDVALAEVLARAGLSSHRKRSP